MLCVSAVCSLLLLGGFLLYLSLSCLHRLIDFLNSTCYAYSFFRLDLCQIWLAGNSEVHFCDILTLIPLALHTSCFMERDTPYSP